MHDDLNLVPTLNEKEKLALDTRFKSALVSSFSFCILVMLIGVFFIHTLYGNLNEDMNKKYKDEIGHLNDLSISKQRELDRIKQVDVERPNSDLIYNTSPPLSSSLYTGGIEQPSNDNAVYGRLDERINYDTEVFGGIYERIKLAVSNSTDKEFIEDVKLIMADEIILFSEYSELSTKYNLDQIIVSHESNKLKESIAKDLVQK